jgi:hypothetical protein
MNLIEFFPFSLCSINRQPSAQALHYHPFFPLAASDAA